MNVEFNEAGEIVIPEGLELVSTEQRGDLVVTYLRKDQYGSTRNASAILRGQNNILLAMLSACYKCGTVTTVNMA